MLIAADKDKVAHTLWARYVLSAASAWTSSPRTSWNFLWITEMPFFEQDEESGKWVAMHHPFTMPMEECIEYLDTAPA